MTQLRRFIFSTNPWIRLSRHIAFWVCDLTNYYLVLSINTDVTLHEALRVLLRMPWVILFTYFLLYVVLPRTGQSVSNNRVWLWAAFSLIVFVIGERYIGYYLVDPFVAPERDVTFNIWDYRRILGALLQNMVVISLAVAIKVVKNKTILERRHETLLAEKQKAELSFLKAQMNPHFLFNTLNTLYSDALTTSAKSQKIVLHLSYLLRFILEECNKPFIRIEKEIDVIRDYVELERLRHGSRLTFDLDFKIHEKDRYISPLLMLPFIENSCKHTLSSIIGNTVISISVMVQDGYAVLNVVNDSFNSAPADISGNLGMGISNIRKQLDLLYDANYDLEITNANGKFCVHLKIPTNHGTPDLLHHHRRRKAGTRSTKKVSIPI